MSWLIETLIATTILMAIVLLIRRPVAHLAGPRIAYLLWLAPALRMVMPPLPAHWFGAAPIAPAPLQGMTEIVIPIGPAALPAASTVEAATFDWTVLLLAFWSAGALLFFVGHALAYADFSRRARQRATGLMEAEGVPVIASPLVPSPVALGLFRPQILVPVDFLWRYEAAERRLALAHELVHHRRRDLAANVAGLAILSLHWWNPVAHLAWRAFRLDQEAACDAVVLAGSSPSDRRAYGSALYKSASGQMPLAVCALGSPSQLKARLRRIARGSRTAMPMRGVAAALFGVGAGVVMTASTISIAAPAEAEPVAPPAMLALNGVEIDTDAPEVRLALATAEKAEAKAADADAEAARVEAEAGDVEAEAAGIEAEAAGEAARATADAAREAAEAAREAAEMARAEARKAIATAGKCKDGTRMSAQVIDKGSESMRIVLCGKTIYDRAALSREVVAGLSEARADIARDRDIPDRVRASVLASLDRQLAQWRRGGVALPEPPAPPAVPAVPDADDVPAPPAPPEVSNACPAGTRHTHVVARTRDGRSETRVSCDGRTIVAVTRR